MNIYLKNYLIKLGCKRVICECSSLGLDNAGVPVNKITLLARSAIRLMLEYLAVLFDFK